MVSTKKYEAAQLLIIRSVSWASY